MDTLKSDQAVKLTEIYTALSEVEKLRFSDNLSKSERDELERAAVTLKREEQRLIKNINEEIVAQIKQSSLSLDELAKSVRARSTKLSKTAKGIDKATKAILVVVDVIERVKKQISEKS